MEADSTAPSSLLTTHSSLPTTPEEIRVLDPACGSGHMLTYAFDLLYAIYEEEGYDPVEIPALILRHNLYGIEIDPRAGALAAFALTMKARAKDRRFFRRVSRSSRAAAGGEANSAQEGGLLRSARNDNPTPRPNILVMENITFSPQELENYKKAVGADLFTQILWETLTQFEQARTFGALIRPILRDAAGMRRTLAEKGAGSDLFLYNTHEKALRVLEMAEYLSPRYHVVVANPPYMGGRGQNAELKKFLGDYYPDVKSDLFSAFIIRNLELALPGGQLGFMTPFVWMFISSYEKLRHFLIDHKTITSLIQLEYSGFEGATVPICTFTLENAHHANYKGAYIRLSDFRGAANQAPKALEAIRNPDCGWFYRARAADFKKIPGAPIAYWVSERVREVFEKGVPLGKIASPRQGLATADNNRFLRLWYEVPQERIGFGMESRDEAKSSGKRWFPYNKGGEYRKWFGNAEFLVNWENDGKELFDFRPKSVIRNPQYYFKSSVSWSKISSGNLAMRYYPSGFIFDVAGTSIFATNETMLFFILAFANTVVTRQVLKAISPTLNFEVGHIASLPIIEPDKSAASKTVQQVITFARQDWDSYETSWDFSTLPLLRDEHRGETLAATFANLRRHWQAMTLEMQRLEEENNRIFIDAYGLQDELTPEVPLKEITLTCNPYYRYGSAKTVGSEQWKVVSSQSPELAATLEEIAAANAAAEGDDLERAQALEIRLLQDTLKEYISYAVGCMFGRYSLDVPGLVLANQGETLDDYIRKVCSEEWVAGSEEWAAGRETVDSEGVQNGEGSELQRTDRLAKGYEPGGDGLPGDETVSKGRTLRADQPSQTFGGVNPVQYRGRASQEIDGRVSEILVNCERFKSRDGNPNPACPALELCNERYRAGYSRSIDRSQSAAARANQQSEVTPHCPLSAIHFLPDDDNVIPVIGGGWFPDDIVERFKQFLKVTFGEVHYEENLRFLETALGKDLEAYFIKDFYKDHVQRYKKRPIYWLFSSPKGSFQALIYMHRYRPETVSVVLDYLRNYRRKLASHRAAQEHLSVSGNRRERARALKEMGRIDKILLELKDYEERVLYPLAGSPPEIDLDDGVKANYPKFGKALKKIL